MTDTLDSDQKHIFEDAVRNLELCAELVTKHLEGEEKLTQIKELKAVMSKYCVLDNNWKYDKNVLNEVEKSLREDNNINEIDEMYANLKENQGHADPRKHAWNLSFDKKISQWISNATDLDDTDCDIVNTGETQSFLDPFTLQQITDPVKNRNCGHSYEKSVVLKVLQKKKQIRCPVVGCANPDYFNKRHLDDNPEMMRQIMLIANNSDPSNMPSTSQSHQDPNITCTIID